MGYISTSDDKAVALHFALKGPTAPEKVAILFEIDFRGDKGLFKMSAEYTAYPSEAEILIQDGFEYRITDNKEVTDAESGQ